LRDGAPLRPIARVRIDRGALVTTEDLAGVGEQILNGSSGRLPPHAELEVPKIVVVPNAVAVVDDLIPAEFATEDARHDKAMFEDLTIPLCVRMLRSVHADVALAGERAIAPARPRGPPRPMVPADRVICAHVAILEQPAVMGAAEPAGSRRPLAAVHVASS
jgi:hypothetical protein